MGDEVEIRLAFYAAEKIKLFDVSIHIENSYGQAVLRLATRETGGEFRDVEGAGVIVCSITKLRILPGRYYLLLAASVPPSFEYLDYVSQAVSFDVLERDVYGTGKVPTYGAFFTECKWSALSTDVAYTQIGV
jgi:hypothetical protein